MTNVIEARGLSKDYGTGVSKVSALRSIDLVVERGAFVAIMGPSGCGKSTLLNVLAGLDRPTAGEVWLDGEHIDELSEADLARLRQRKVGFVFQSFNLIPTLSAGENVELPLRLAGRRRRDVRRTADRLLADLGIENRRNTAPAVLSGGEQQRVARHMRWQMHRTSCLPTNRPGTSILRQPRTCLGSCEASAIAGKHCWSSPTMHGSPRRRIESSRFAMVR